MPALPKRHLYALHDDVMDFAPLLERRFAQGFVNTFGQVHAGMNHT
jgi:hypothetical protein